MVKTIGNPLSWTAEALGIGAHNVSTGASEIGGLDIRPIEIRKITPADLRIALRKGVDDFMALRTDVIFIVLVYPVMGALLVWFAVNRDLLPLVFPLISGFALLGPVAAIGLYEMSRRRERGEETGWGDAFGVMASPSFYPIVIMGGYLVVLFVLWMIAAHTLYGATLGPDAPASIPDFLRDIFTTREGWTLLIVGNAIGLVFAIVILSISLVSFPLLLDRHVGLPRAVVTSVRIARANPVTVALWGALVVLLLGVGVLTLLVGLIFVLPILGHATWHLYRRAVVQLPDAPAA